MKHLKPSNLGFWVYGLGLSMYHLKPSNLGLQLLANGMLLLLHILRLLELNSHALQA